MRLRIFALFSYRLAPRRKCRVMSSSSYKVSEFRFQPVRGL